MKKVIYTLLLLTLSTYSFVHAQSSYLAGSMRIIQEDTPEAYLTLEARVQLISPIDSPVEDSIPVFWGDGSSGWLLLLQETTIPPELVRRFYTNTHTYPARASYTITSPACCFSETIANLDPGATMPLQTHYTILNPQVQGTNSTVIVSDLEATGPVNEPLGFSPTPFDTDNDSIWVSVPELDDSFSGYQPVNVVDSGGSGTLIVENPLFGGTVWDSPGTAGQSYTVPYHLEEFRNGQRISNTLVYYWIQVATPTSTTTTAKPDLKVFPNPTSQTLQVQTENPTQWSGVLYNAQGQRIQQWANLPADGQIDLSCPGGLYLLQLQSGDQVRTERIVVR
jgi:hypothetical protein